MLLLLAAIRVLEILYPVIQNPLMWYFVSIAILCLLIASFHRRKYLKLTK